MPETNAPLHDPTALMNFGDLDVVAKRVVEGFMIGQHRSPLKGSSVEFVEHRQYYPGDDVRHIDWRAYGKTKRHFIKEFEDETNLRCRLIVDCSGSMAYAGRTLSKFAYASQLAAVLGYLLLQQRDAVGWMTLDTQIRESVEPSAKQQAFPRLVDTLSRTLPGGETNLGEVLDRVVPILQRRSLVVILSDCFDDPTNLARSLRQFRHARHEVLLFHIVAPEEEEFPFSKPTQFRNLEQPNNRRLVDPHRLRSDYLKKYQEFCDELRLQAMGVGVDYHKFTTADPYARALGAYLDARTRLSKGRRNGPAH